MIEQLLEISRQIDDRHYQFLIPTKGNWNEALAFAQEICKHCSDQLNIFQKAEEEKAKQAATIPPSQ
jgi:hypothetical protein